MRTSFGYFNSHIRQRDQTHWRANDEGRLDPWVILFEFLEVVHFVKDSF
jgi:hypothetical protein